MDQELKDATRKMFEHYEEIRGKDKSELGDAFWDLVVVTASDEEQRDAFQCQIKDKLDKGHIPSGIPYLVYADPPGPKLGCGGSTMFVLGELKEKYGAKLEQWRVLMLHAGGQSQRLPSASVLGKLFTPLPLGNPMWQQFDVKLASYLSLFPRMKPGVFHAAADSIEIFVLDPDDDWTLEREGFTALAHPSSLDIGRGHGVYVLDNPISNKSGISQLRTCLEVLQKPSKQRMKERGAVIPGLNGKDDFVFTDSCFYFDFAIADKMRLFYEQEGPLNCEICSYGDFLQCLGPRSSIAYTEETQNVKTVEQNLVDMRKKIYNLLHNSKLNIIALDKSRFYHFGTMQEYIFHFCEDAYIAEVLGFSRVAFSVCNTDQPHEKKAKLQAPDSAIHGCVMHSLLSPSTTVPEQTLIEYCKFSVPVMVGKNCILSNCEYTDEDVCSLTIPADTFMHTVPVQVSNKIKYVTVFYSVRDDLKKGVAVENIKELKFIGTTLGEAAGKFDLDNLAVIQGRRQTTTSLWSLSFFPAMPSPSESFLVALQALSYIQGNRDRPEGYMVDRQLLSMQDILKQKAIRTMIHNRNLLREEIVSRI